jgi:hypothetical protein
MELHKMPNSLKNPFKFTFEEQSGDWAGSIAIPQRDEVTAEGLAAALAERDALYGDLHTYTDETDAVEVEIIEAGVNVVAHGRNGVDYRGVVLATNPEAGEALVKVWDREAAAFYTAWWKAEWLDVVKATARAAANAAVQAA